MEYRKYYTLRRKNPDDVANMIVYPEEFMTYEDAYKAMCKEYDNDCKYRPTKINFWSIWVTSVSFWNGRENSMTQKA